MLLPKLVFGLSPGPLLPERNGPGPKLLVLSEVERNPEEKKEDPEKSADRFMLLLPNILLENELLLL